jgi:tRNA A37 threonylcarbamoyladenosine dehydratase
MNDAENNMANPQALFQRLALITGAEALEKFAQTKVMVFGIGGVGSWCAEALARSGIGKICIVDYDTVCASNINRQVQATTGTLGRIKVDVFRQRLLEINPNCEVTAWEKMFSRENAAEFGIETANYVIDAIDSLPHKLDLIEISSAPASINAGVKLFSSMGMAWKMDPTRIKTGCIWETNGCPLARLVRQGLRKRGFDGSFTVVYSDEQIQRPDKVAYDEFTGGKKINGSAVTVTASAGMILASLVLRNCMVKNE